MAGPLGAAQAERLRRTPCAPPGRVMSHMDVVPAPEGAAYNWTHPPFGGVVADGYIWGRGALDVKVTLLQQLEALSLLLAQGWVAGVGAGRASCLRRSAL